MSGRSTDLDVRVGNKLGWSFRLKALPTSATPGPRGRARLERDGHRLDQGRGETPYFRFACFGNMNLHLWFMLPDLLAKLNRMAGGKNLHEATAPRS